MEDKIVAKGVLKLTLYKSDGQVTETTHNNLIVNLGKALIASRFGNGAGSAVSKMALGTGTTATTANDTALVTEIVEKAVEAPVSVTTTVANDTVEYTCSFQAGEGTGAITEAGLLTAEDLLFSRTVFPVINKGAEDRLTITWRVIFQ